MKIISLVVLAILGLNVSAEIFYWKNDTVKAENWKSYADWNNWAVGTSADGNNENRLIPSATDDLCYGVDQSWETSLWMDLGGLRRELRHVTGGDSDYGYRFLHLKNGTLAFNGSFTNSAYRISVYDTGKLVLAEGSASRFGRGTQVMKLDVLSGGIAELRGKADIVVATITVHEGGTLELAADGFGADLAYPLSATSRVVNAGTLNLPNGFSFGGAGTVGGKNFELVQQSGTLNLGGQVLNRSTTTSLKLLMRGGMVNVSDNVSFVSNDSKVKCIPVVANGCSVAFCVNDGKTFDASNMEFGEETLVSKTGLGAFRTGKSFPTSFVVSEGVFEPSSGAKLGSALSFAPNTTLRFVAPGVQADAISGIENVDVEVADSFGDKSFILFSSPDTALVAAIFDKLMAQGITGFENRGDSITYEKAHDSTVFTFQSAASQIGTSLDSFEDAKGYLNFFDVASWSIGRGTAGVNPDGYVPGETDDIYINTIAADSYRPLLAFDMGGAVRLVRNYDKTDAVERWGFNGIQIRNGTFGFSGNFESTRSVIVAQAGGRFVFGDDAKVVLGYGGAQCYGIVRDGGEIVLAGDITFNAFQYRIDAGGVMTINPKGGEMKFVTTGDAPNTFIYNSGTLNIPNGLALSGSGRMQCDVTLEMKDGFTLNIGGNLVHELGTKGNFVFKMHSGTINAANTASVSGFAVCSVADGAAITVNVPKGSKLKLSQVMFGEGTTVEKFGSGRLVFGSSRPSNYIRHDPMPGFSIIVR